MTKNLEKHSMDRRVARTRRALQHAFMKLIVEKGYERTSIQDICEAANVGRSTFYLHYDSKDELKRAGLEHLRRELVDASAKVEMSGERGGGALAFSSAFFNHAYRHVNVYRAMIGCGGGGGGGGGAVALATIREILIDLVRADPYLSTAIKSNRVVVSIIVGAFMEVLTDWLDTGAETEPEEIDAAFRHFIARGIAPTGRGG
ncbi:MULTISPECIES: TetR/AcrR family transcriptional regulator [Asticcacaulis]|uniref:TetR/AcrR family transcriptional regulator n=1 Tax=Asticcacaulis TaxID=76890 RepID=UPI001AE50A3D|nr:TetR/AcrR family transcriptional regulator [Asticcacaulis sp. BE141]MBP2160483.1 AcrR family transcriptional regulator [Asticcacaulis solisilvae]MDR6801528.1 AcrR family transcriptional regulator [Asticcacaulis sp. BE141]